MSPQLASGLKALANLLCPPGVLSGSGFGGGGGGGGGSGRDRVRHTLPHVALTDVYYASDTEEIPYTGETLLHLSKVKMSDHHPTKRTKEWRCINRRRRKSWARPLILRGKINEEQKREERKPFSWHRVALCPSKCVREREPGSDERRERTPYGKERAGAINTPRPYGSPSAGQEMPSTPIHLHCARPDRCQYQQPARRQVKLTGQGHR